MKKVNFILIPIFLAFTCACNISDSSEKEPAFEHHFETDKEVYSINDTVIAQFINKSDQRIYLNYQVCTIVKMQKLETITWKSIPIPIICTGEVKDPIEVDPGEKIETGVSLQVFDENKLEAGFYRLDVMATRENENDQQELTSNNFIIKKMPKP